MALNVWQNEVIIIEQLREIKENVSFYAALKLTTPKLCKL